MDKQAATQKIAELMDGVHICTVTTLDKNGQLVSRPMAMQNETFDGQLWFFTTDHSAKVAQINANPQVNVAFENSSSYVSISGTAQPVDDKAKAKQLWSPALKGWFPDGIDTPDLLLLCVDATSAEYWDSSSNKLVTLFAYAKASVTGKRPDVGENEVVNLQD